MNLKSLYSVEILYTVVIQMPKLFICPALCHFIQIIHSTYNPLLSNTFRVYDQIKTIKVYTQIVLLMSVKYAKEAIIRHTFSHHHPNSAGYDSKFHHINNKKLEQHAHTAGERLS